MISRQTGTDATHPRNRQDGWTALEQELDKWANDGRNATFWWRDDDAVQASPQLERLALESVNGEAPVLLAVIPRNVQASLVSALAGYGHFAIGQHGYAHINHAPRGQGTGAWELGLHRGEQAVMEDLACGHEILTERFGSRFLPVVLPPWNRIDPGLFQPMAEFGFTGVSTSGPRDCAEPVAGLVQVNCHCDPIKWKGGARFTGMEKSFAMVTEHLGQRRENSVDADEPTGLLTHHLDMDEEAWTFVSRLVNILDQHPAASWCPPDTLFKAGN